jgi:hypothetical protein
VVQLLADSGSGGPGGSLVSRTHQITHGPLVEGSTAKGDHKQ